MEFYEKTVMIKEDAIQALLGEALRWTTISIPRAVQNHAILSHFAAAQSTRIDYSTLSNSITIDTRESMSGFESQLETINSFFQAHNVVLEPIEEKAVQSGSFRMHSGEPMPGEEIEALLRICHDVNVSLQPINIVQARIAMDAPNVIRDRKTTSDASNSVIEYYSQLNGYLNDAKVCTRELQKIAILMKRALTMNVDTNPIEKSLREINQILMARHQTLSLSMSPYHTSGLKVTEPQLLQWEAEMERRFTHPNNIVHFASINRPIGAEQTSPYPHEVNATLFELQVRELFRVRASEFHNDFPEIELYIGVANLTNEGVTKSYTDMYSKLLQLLLSISQDASDNAAQVAADSVDAESAYMNRVSFDLSAVLPGITRKTEPDFKRFDKVRDVMEKLMTEITNLAKQYGGIRQGAKHDASLTEDQDVMLNLMNEGLYPIYDKTTLFYFHSFSGKGEWPGPSSN